MPNPSDIVTIFTLPQAFPCGPQSSCCGPIGQTEEEIESLRWGIEGATGCPVEVINVADDDNYDRLMEYSAVVRLLHSFGPAALPIIAVNGDAVSIGSPSLEEVVSAIKQAAAGT